MPENILSQGIKTLGLSIPSEVQQRLLDFLAFLQKWNRAYNLTAITDDKKMVTYHLLDSLAIAPYVKGQHILDVGTGAGFPGIPLAFAFPDKHVVLLDSRGKKTRFLLQAVAHFQVSNVTVVQARMENFSSARCFDVIICRAVGEIADIVKKTNRLLCSDGQWLLMKGEIATTELAGLTQPVNVIALSVPGLKAKRQVVIIPQNLAR